MQVGNLYYTLRSPVMIEIERLEKSYMESGPKCAGFLYRGVAKRLS